MIEFPVFPVVQTIQLDDHEYFPYLLGTVRTAKTRFWGSVFIVDTMSDPDQKVRQLLKELAYACWRYVDVRLLIGNSDIETISIGNGTSRRYGQSLGVPIRTYNASQGKKSLHSKYAVIDNDLIMIGSHNWTKGALSANREGSVAVRSSPLARILAREFESLWQATEA